MHLKIAALLIGGTLLATSPVNAETIAAADGTMHQAVPHTDLDLATPSGRAKLNRRIALGLESVCGSYAQLTVDEQDEVTRCRRDAHAKLAPQLARILDADVTVASAAHAARIVR